MTSNFSVKVEKVKTAIFNKITASISTHNSDANAHSSQFQALDNKIGDIITFFNGTGGTLTAGDNIGAGKVIDANSANYSHIGTLSSGATQQEINSALDSKISALEGIEFIKVTTDKGTASASTMNKLFIEVKQDSTDLYYTKATESAGGTTSYAWVKLEDNILEDLSVDWSDITNKPTILTQTDIDNSIGDFSTALAERINPSS